MNIFKSANDNEVMGEIVEINRLTSHQPIVDVDPDIADQMGAFHEDALDVDEAELSIETGDAS